MDYYKPDKLKWIKVIYQILKWIVVFIIGGLIYLLFGGMIKDAIKEKAKIKVLDNEIKKDDKELELNKTELNKIRQEKENEIKDVKNMSDDELRAFLKSN